MRIYFRFQNLSENNLGTEGARMIASIMSNNDTITRLDISGIAIISLHYKSLIN